MGVNKISQIELLKKRNKTSVYENEISVPISQDEIVDKINEIIEYLNNIKGKNIMKLQDTVELMNSTDFKERFKAEYWQTKIRYDSLHSLIVKCEAGTLSFKPKCSLELLKKQASFMGQYLYVLESRAEIENVIL